MPPTDWTNLQEGLVLHGFLSPDAIVEVRSQDDINPELVDAVLAAQDSIGDAVIIEEHLDFDRFERLRPFGDALAGRFCGVPDTASGIGPLTFGASGGRWSRGTLNVSINEAGCNFVNDPPPTPTDVGTSVGPSVAQIDGRTYMTWKGLDGDSGIYWSRL